MLAGHMGHSSTCTTCCPLQIMARYALSLFDLAGCGINPAAAIGTQFNVTYWVWNTAAPPQNATVSAGSQPVVPRLMARGQC
jgi:hypothetical protein